MLSALAVGIAAPAWIDTLAGRATGGLLRSYDVDGDTPFDRTHGNCAYVYDNAVVGFALLRAGRPAQARVIGDALLAAQARDRFYRDGRLRNAYAAGRVAATGDYPLPGWYDNAQGKWVEDIYHVSSATGVVAWAMLFWCALSRATGDARYAVAAGRAGDWVARMTRTTQGFSGGFLGWEPSPAPVGWASTEHNLDLSLAFAALGRSDLAARAADFVRARWDAAEGRFCSGLTPDGAVNRHSAADANLWPLLAPGAPQAWWAALDWVVARHGVPAGAPLGIDFDTDRDGIWLEGTAYLVLAARRAGRAALADTAMATLRAQTAPGGLVYASSVPRLTTGLATGLTAEADFYYYRRPHIAATGWAAMALAGTDPFSR
jgi:hypothetical protein